MHVKPITQVNDRSDFLEMELDLLGEPLNRKNKKPVHSEKQLRFLIADDNADMLEYIGSSLLSAYSKAEIVYAHTGQQALQEIRRRIPDLIITDWDMPGMNGLELAKNVQPELQKQGIPLLLVTGMELSMEARMRIRSLHITSVLRKPFDREKLISKVQQMLTHNSSHPEP